MKRRESLKLISALPLVAAFPSLARAEDKFPMGKLVDPSKPPMMPMQYVHDASTSKSPIRKPKSNCANCDKYNKCMTGVAGCKPYSAAELKKKGQAPCEIFNSGEVKATGWCISWVPKA